MIGLPMAYHALGRKAESDAALAALIAKSEKTAPYGIAYVCAFRGEADKAFDWLDKAVEYHNPGLAEIVPENLFDKIRSDPRWLPFLRRIGKGPRAARADQVQTDAAAMTCDQSSEVKLEIGHVLFLDIEDARFQKLARSKP